MDGQDENCEFLGDGEIVALVTENKDKNEELEDKEMEDNRKMTHSEG